MEDFTRKACEGLIHDAVVVGSGRKLPALLIELPTTDAPNAETKERIAKEVISRLTELNAKAYPHERIDDPARVFVVAKGALPRTAVSRPSGVLS